MKKTLAICIVLAVIAAAPVFSKDIAMPKLAMPTAASNGFGGTHVAYTDNVYSLLVNPAAMIKVEQKSFFTLAPSLVNPQSTFSFIDPIDKLISSGGDDTNAIGNAADTLSKQEGKIALGFDLREFPFSVAWVANGFGFGVWNRAFVNPNIMGTDIEAVLYADLMIPVGFAFKILDLNGHTVDAGVTVKPFARVFAQEHVDILNLMDENYEIEDEINIPVLVGAGLDLGFTYRWDTGLSAGLTFDDIVTRGNVVGDIIGKSSGNYYVPFNMNLGVAYDVKLGRFLPDASSVVQGLGFTIAADWRDITNIFLQDDYLNQRNAVLDLGLGFQFSMFDIIKIRLGMSEMLPAAGLGFDLGPIEIDLAYYGKEFGYEPGMLPAAAVDLSIGVRPGAKKRDWPWARRSVFGTFGIGN